MNEYNVFLKRYNMYIAKFEITMNYVFLKTYNHIAKFEIMMNYIFLKTYNHIAKF